MARYTGPVCRLCRREKTKLFLKGDKCYSAKCALNDPKFLVPGQHGASRKKPTDYSIQLREKQKAKRFYGILESRLDNIVYRLGFAMSRIEARQLVTHGHFEVNGKRVDIPSYLVSEGDVISVKDSSKDSTKLKAVMEANASKPLCAWLESDKENMKGKVVRLPKAEEIDMPLEMHLIVELYSK